MKWRIDDVPMFRAVIERGGITAAAATLGVPKSTVSKAVGRLEHGLGVRLLERNSRKVRVTAEGEAFYHHCQLIMDQVAEADARMAGLTSVPGGRLAVALPAAFCQEILAPRLAMFRQRYPGIALDLVVPRNTVDILGEPFDVAIVVGPQPDSDFTRKTLLGGRLIWVTSPAYRDANRIGGRVEDLVAHIHVCETRYAGHPLPVRCDGAAATIALPETTIRVNDPIAVRQAVLGGAGVSFIPDRYGARQLASGALVEVCRHIAFDISASALSAVFPSRHLLSARVRAFLDFLDEVCRDDADAAG